MIYDAINRPVFDRVPKTARRILDLGCGSGALGSVIKQSNPCEIVGVTYSEIEAVQANKVLDQVLVRDLNTFDPVETGRFDCIICSHVLEHLYAPEKLLGLLQSNMDASTTIIIALPNILHWHQRIKFAGGSFRYTEGGLMDGTHFRFFDWDTAQQMLRESGLRIIEAKADGQFPYARFLGPLAPELNGLATRTFPGFFGFQFIFVCRLIV